MTWCVTASADVKHNRCVFFLSRLVSKILAPVKKKEDTQKVSTVFPRTPFFNIVEIAFLFEGVGTPQQF